MQEIEPGVFWGWVGLERRHLIIGERYEIIKHAIHEDFKTVCAFPERNWEAKTGETVTLKKVWINCYGTQFRVETEDGRPLDISGGAIGTQLSG